MPLSRLENFLKNAEGNILYVNPSDFDATDSFENQGNSLTRPFKSIQRALVEAARFSYQAGDNNDKIDRTTILVYPGTHYIDNRPGFSIEEINGAAVFKEQTAPGQWEERSLPEFGETTNFDIFDPANDLRKYNAVAGGAVLPRGTSIIGLDLRKTKIRPLYVPDPYDTNVEESSIFNVTGTCYFTAFTIFDGDPTKTVYKNYSQSRVVPNFSHHKLTTFTYIDGVNKVKLGNYQTYLTDLDMYYYKVAKAYGDITGRGLADFPVGTDFEPSIDEFRIVGALEANPLGISSIRAGNGDGTGDINVITVTTADRLTGSTAPHNLFVNSPFLLNGVEVDSDSYNGSFTVKEVVGINTFTFTTNQSPLEFLPNPTEIDTATVSSGSDTVSSASPYIFNVSLRSVFGMCGMHADGSKAAGFKSMVVAQYTGVSLQKDDNAFLLYDEGAFYDENTLPENSPERPLHTNSKAIFKPDFENSHIRASNNAFIQAVSIFAIGYSHHFLTESGGDMSITNSNSNFGNTSLESTGFKPDAFNRDDTGFITHIIPPRELVADENSVTWLSLDAEKIINAADTSKLYIAGARNEEVTPAYQVDGYRVGARDDDELNLTITIGTAQTNYTAPILMPVNGGNGVSARKSYQIVRSNNENDIVNDTISLTQGHQLINGEKVRIFADNGQAPDGIDNEGIYFAITTGVGANQIKLAQSVNDALANQPILGIANNGGVITIVSRVSDKLPGDLGHPIQFDESESNWYLQSDSNNDIREAIVDIGITELGSETSTSFINRKLDNRSIDDKIYKIRYVIPKEYTNAKPPEAGYVIQESGNVGVSSISFTNDTLSDSTEIRNEKVISSASAGPIISNAQVVTLTTELPHGLSSGDTVEIKNVRSVNNSLATGITSSFNGRYEIESVLNSKQFQYTISGVSTNPGTFSNDINQRATRQQRESLPTFSRAAFDNTFFIYRAAQVKRHIPGADGQDGIYHLICLQSNVSPPSSVGFNLDSKEFNQDVINLYPQLDRDNLNTNPKSATSYASLQVLGSVVTNDKRNSITREAIDYFTKNSSVGIAITSVIIAPSANHNGDTVTIGTEVEHGFNKIKEITFTSGAGYTPSAIFYAVPLNPISSSGQGATAKVTTNASGEVIDVSLVDPGSAYTTNNTLEIPGGTTNSIVTVSSVVTNAQVTAVEIHGYNEDTFNGVYKIESVSGPKTLILDAPAGISTYRENTTGEKGYVIPSNDIVGLTSAYMTNAETGITTVTVSSAHGLLPGNSIKILFDNGSLFSGDYVVNDVVGLTTFTYVSTGSTSYLDSSSGIILRKTIAPNALNLGSGEENLGSRGSVFYDGLTATTNVQFDTTSSTISFLNPEGVRRGDFLDIRGEIVRVASTSNPFDVIRGQLGTVKITAPSGSKVRRIKVLPIEVRRPSFMRASGHTFEYLGFGPGNYSTGMPQKQDRILSDTEVIVSQSKEQRGGQVVYTGMNDLGEFFSGSKKLSSATGEETVIDAPILTYTGDDSQGESSAVSSGIFDELLVRQRLTVEGGENNNQSSQFYGPVNFTQKVTNLSEYGIETKDLFIKGTAAQSKLITVGISTPTSNTVKSPRVGDIQLLSNPSDDYIGHVRVDNEWKSFGLISRTPDQLDIRVDKLHVNTTSNSNFDFDVDGNSRVENLVVSGSIVFQQPQSLGNATFEDIIVNRTARFTMIGLDPVTGLSTNYNMIMSAGISQLKDLDVTGVSTFAGRADFESNIFGIGAKFGNFRIGITDDNTIDTTAGDIVLNSDNGTTNIVDNLIVNGDKIELAKGDGVSLGGTITSRNDARVFQLGMGSTDGSSKIVLHANDTTSGLKKEGITAPEGSLTIHRTADTTSTVGDTLITHQGASDLVVSGASSGSRIVLKTDNTERVNVGTSGTITFSNTNNGTALKGQHVSIVQSGDGDSALSWVHDKNNINQRWYAGIDVSDNYAWKLAHPESTLAFNSEDWDNTSETKLTVNANGNTTVGGGLTVGGDFLLSSAATLNLFTKDTVQASILTDAHTLTLGSNSATSYLTLRGTKDSTSTTTGALVVGGGVGIAKNLYVGGHMGDTDIQGTLDVKGNVKVKKSTGTDTLTINASNGDITSSGRGTFGSDCTITGSLTVSSSIDVNGGGDVAGNFSAAKLIKKNPGDGTNFLRANGTDTKLTNQDFINSLGFVPGQPVTMSAYPIGNSILLKSFESEFNGSKKEFNLKAPDGVAFIPIGPVNLLVSLGGVIQEAGKGYTIKQSGGSYTSVIRFNDAPPSGMDCYIIALGGQGSLTANPEWTKKGQLLVGKKQNEGNLLPVGSNGRVLTADSSVALGMAWKEIPPAVLTGSIIYWPSSSIPSGYQKCDGSAPATSALRSIVGNNVPNMINRFVLGGNTPNKTGGTDKVALTVNNLPEHSHTLSEEGDHNHTKGKYKAGRSIAVSHDGHTHPASNGENSGGHVHTINDGGSHKHNYKDPGHDHSYQETSFNSNRKLDGQGEKAFKLSKDGSRTGKDGIGIEISNHDGHKHNMQSGGGKHQHKVTVDKGGGHDHDVTIQPHGKHNHGGQTGAYGRPPDKISPFSITPRYIQLMPIIKT